MKPVARVGAWLAGPAVGARLTRAVSTLGAIWAFVQFLDRFKVASLPEGRAGVGLFALIALIAFQSVELWLLHRQLNQARHQRPSLEDFTPEEAFANGVVRYASKLNDAQARRDTAVLEIRQFATRPLHLMGAVDARVQLGEIALTAASNLDDRLTEASILVDELGWTLHLQGSADKAIRNLRSAVSILDSLVSSGARTEIAEWKAKALRHIANIEAQRASNLANARAQFAAPREAATKLPGPLQATYSAQVDHSEAEVILKSLNTQLGDDGKVDVGGPTQVALNEGLALIESALSSFDSLNDKERAVKAAHAKVGLLRHGNDDAALTIARQRLERTKLEASRIAYLP